MPAAERLPAAGAALGWQRALVPSLLLAAHRDKRRGSVNRGQTGSGTSNRISP